MRYSFTPHAVPSSSAQSPAARGGAAARRRRWVATIPAAFLIPLLLLPTATSVAATPTLSIRGTPVAGQTIRVKGSGFNGWNRVQLAWDGSTSNMPAPYIRSDGTFAKDWTIPSKTTAGSHVLAARKMNSTTVLAKMTVTVSSTVTATPAPTATPVATPVTTPAPVATSAPTATPTPAALATAAPTATPTPAPVATATAAPVATATPAPTTAATPAPTTAATSSVILCDGRTFEGFTTTPFMLDGGIYADPKVTKIIRNCTFRNASSDREAIRIKNASNVVIQNSTFINIHSGMADNDTHAINVLGNAPARDIVVRWNHFEDIGGDGIQLGSVARDIARVTIEDNKFLAPDDGSAVTPAGLGTVSWSGGENGIDVKGVNGPIYLRRNTVIGFDACVTGDFCSGSGGTGVTVHDGGTIKTRANDVWVESNTFIGNAGTGLGVSDADNVRVNSNRFEANTGYGVHVQPEAAACTQNGANLVVSGAGLSWGPCKLNP